MGGERSLLGRRGLDGLGSDLSGSGSGGGSVFLNKFLKVSRMLIGSLPLREQLHNRLSLTILAPSQSAMVPGGCFFRLGGAFVLVPSNFLQVFNILQHLSDLYHAIPQEENKAMY